MLTMHGGIARHQLPGISKQTLYILQQNPENSSYIFFLGKISRKSISNDGLPFHVSVLEALFVDHLEDDVYVSDGPCIRKFC